MHNLAGEKLKELLKLHGKSLQDLARQTDIHASRWSQVINGTKRLSIDLAIRLGKVFPGIIGQDMPNYGETRNLWLHWQFLSDKATAEAQDGLMYRNIKPFGGNE